MAEATTEGQLTGLIPMAHVANVQRSVDFYKLLGMELRGSLKAGSGAFQWAHISSGNADLMLTRASEPVIPWRASPPHGGSKRARSVAAHPVCM